MKISLLLHHHSSPPSYYLPPASYCFRIIMSAIHLTKITSVKLLVHLQCFSLIIASPSPAFWSHLFYVEENDFTPLPYQGGQTLGIHLILQLIEIGREMGSNPQNGSNFAIPHISFLFPKIGREMGSKPQNGSSIQLSNSSSDHISFLPCKLSTYRFIIIQTDPEHCDHLWRRCVCFLRSRKTFWFKAEDWTWTFCMCFQLIHIMINCKCTFERNPLLAKG